MKKKLLATLCAISLCVGLLAGTASAFTVMQLDPADVFSPELIEKEKVSEWAQDEIALARAAGLITERTGDYMTRSITRLQFAELAVNLAEKATGKEIAASASDTFTDCADAAVLKANAAGIVNGVGDGKFAPDQQTNREQIASMLHRTITYIAQQKSGSYLKNPADISAFSDKAQVSSWAVEGVGALAANEIMKGSSGKLSPKDGCTIEQSILLVYRIYTLVNA